MITRMSTKQMIAASYIELAQSRPIEKISVEDIVMNCGISPVLKGKKSLYILSTCVIISRYFSKARVLYKCNCTFLNNLRRILPAERS